MEFQGSSSSNTDSLLTSYQVGALLQVNPSSINNWVKAGLLAAHRTPGGHLRIKVADLVAFLDAHKMPVPEAIGKGGRRRLLVADEDRKQLNAYRRIFKPYADRLDFVLADNAIDALVHVGALRPHLMLLPASLGDLDGLEVCRRLKANPETRGIELIIASARVSPEAERRARRLGVRWVTKPIKGRAIIDELGLPSASA